MYIHKKTVRYLSAVLALSLLLPTSFNLTAVSADKSAEGNAMQCGTLESTKGFIRKPIDSPPSDEYFINFHYRYPKEDYLADFVVWGSYDGEEYDDLMLYQTGDKLFAAVGSRRDEADIRIEPDVWHNILIHVKEDNTVSLYINGRRAKIGGLYDYPQIGTGRMTALGYIGDLSTASHNGMGYIDNIRVFTKDRILVTEDFNKELSDWTFYTTAFLADPPVSTPLPEPVDAAIRAEKRGFSPGEKVNLFPVVYLNDQTEAVLSFASFLSVESGDPETVRIVEEEGAYFAEGLKEGSCVITLKAVYDGKELTASEELFVSEDPVLYEIEFRIDKPEIVPGESTKVKVTGKFTDGSEEDLTNEAVVKSGDSSVLRTEERDGSLYATGTGEGVALLTAEYIKDGKQLKASASVTVLSLIDTETAFGKDSVFKGDSGSFFVYALLSNGQKTDSSVFSRMELKSSDPDVLSVSLKDGVPYYEATGVGEASITITCALGEKVFRKTVTVTSEELSYSKRKSTIYTEEKVANARRNVEKYQWAKDIKNSTLNSASYYVNLGYEALWSFVTDQSIPRSYAVNQTLGCLNCGNAIDKYGNYPYNANHFTAPWKLECPNCKMRFPTNDFAAYYKSGLDENRKFNPDLADKSLLVNTLYPEKGEKWGVDDGYGYIDENGNRYTFVAYYNHWHIWHGGVVSQALSSLRDAYIYSGDLKYARAGAILLDRVADVYPEMDIWPYKVSDGFLNSHGHTGKGKIIGSIWETGLAEIFLTAYDAFFPVLDDPEIVGFLSEKAQQYNLGTKNGAGIRRNIEDGIVRQIYPAVKNGQILGNNGMHQSTLATAAVVLDSLPETKEWLDFNFKSGSYTGDVLTGGNILATFVNDVNRDGHGNESAPGYNMLWLGQYIDVANVLDGYELYPAADLYENPKFRKMFFAMIPLMLTDRYSALIGDSGSTGNPTKYINLDQTVLAYERYKDPLLAQVIYFLNNNSTEGIHGNIFSENPDQVAEDIRKVIEEIGPLHLTSDNLTGYGLSVLRDGYNITYEIGIPYLFPKLSYTATREARDFMGKRVEFEAKEINDSISFDFTVLESGTYLLELIFQRTGFSGIYNVYLDGKKIDRIDFYGNGTETKDLEELFLEKGTHTIEFVCTGQNPEAKGLNMAVNKLVLYDPDMQTMKDIADLGDTQKALWMYYGVTSGHGHADTLNIGINAFGLDLTPELGYPEYADNSPHRMEWVSNTISHNTVTVDRTIQDRKNKTEVPLHFGDGAYVKLTDVDAPYAYGTKGVDYRRTVAMIKLNDEDFYVADFFRVKGGSEHHYSFHGAEGTVETEGLNLTPQTDFAGKYIGTYGGENTEFGIRPPQDTTNSGFHWLINVRKDEEPEDVFSVDWHVKDTWNALGKGKKTDIHIRLTMLSKVDDATVATGIPPRNKPGNPKELEYLIARRSGNDLDSLFVSVIEPYKGERNVEKIERAEIVVNGKVYEGNDAACVKTVFPDGRIDYIVYCTNPDLEITVDGKITFKGFFGVYSERDGIPFYTYTHEGSFKGFGEEKPVRYTGKIMDFTREISVENRITVAFDQNVDLAELTGRYIRIKNTRPTNAVYKIYGAVRKGAYVQLDIGDVTTVERLADVNDFSKGYIYYMEEWQEFTIPLENENIYKVGEPEAKVFDKRLLVSQKTPIYLNAFYETGAPFTETDGHIEIISRNPSAVVIENGMITALRNGKTEIYVKLRRNNEVLRSEPLTITVMIPKARNAKPVYANSKTYEPM
jgi:hypothetical protein